ncbi:hypothetical protein BPAE_0289g00070 [Botrytis paeoniae]|uniref:Uncharacterized protein n=1 Tax=Botrytis paeoniae TaxID=278948 RepID=A0A4Z1FB21_9HELO|nr:hypothetical protein BPAE_0289g00070 [Botrytis paeoniae]
MDISICIMAKIVDRRLRLRNNLLFTGNCPDRSRHCFLSALRELAVGSERIIVKTGVEVSEILTRLALYWDDIYGKVQDTSNVCTSFAE